jgi:hypothetical protein
MDEHYPYIQKNIVFEALTRVKRNLTILVVNNPQLYESIQKILTWKDTIEFKNYTEEVELNNEWSKYISNNSERKSELLEISEIIKKAAAENGIKQDTLFYGLKSILKNQKLQEQVNHFGKIKKS